MSEGPDQARPGQNHFSLAKKKRNKRSAHQMTLEAVASVALQSIDKLALQLPRQSQFCPLVCSHGEAATNDRITFHSYISFSAGPCSICSSCLPKTTGSASQKSEPAILPYIESFAAHPCSLHSSLFFKYQKQNQTKGSLVISASP